MCNKRTIPFLMKQEATQSKIDGIIKNKKERVGLEKQKNLIMNYNKHSTKGGYIPNYLKCHDKKRCLELNSRWKEDLQILYKLKYIIYTNRGGQQMVRTRKEAKKQSP